jgi:antibiotic biosynthesis monooxygenase (ABM) superfamily enzyme
MPRHRKGEAMITLHIYVQVTPAKEAEFEGLYRDEYVPAISKQQGFRSAALLHIYAATLAEAIDARRDWTHEIDIVFDTEDDRQKWAAGPEHARVWPRVESLCERVTWQGFDIMMIQVADPRRASRAHTSRASRP